MWLAKVEVVLFGLKTVGISYRSGEGLLSIEKTILPHQLIDTYFALIL